MNRLADEAASDISDAFRTAAPPIRELPKVRDFVDALKLNTIPALDQAKLGLFTLDIGPTVSTEVGQLRTGFWERLALAIALAGRQALFLEYIDWFAAKRDYQPFQTARSTRLSDAWDALASEIGGMAGLREIAPSEARERMDDLAALAMFTGPLIGNRGASKGDDLAATAIVNSQVATCMSLFVHTQPLMDEGLLELANGSEPKNLRALATRLTALDRITTLQDPVNLQFPIDPVGKAYFIRNSFPPTQRRQFEAHQFDLFVSYGPQPHYVGFEPTRRRRINQIAVALGFYGRAIDPKQEASDTALKTRQSDAKGLRKPTGFQDHDGLIRLLLMIFLETHDPLKATPAEAVAAGWEAATEFLTLYLGIFTAHPGHDLSDLGPDYLATDFPMTIAGEVLHDCAVYALRAGYWLRAMAALLRARNIIDLAMTSRIVILPNHAALVVAIDPPTMRTAGKTLPAGGLLLINNSHVDTIAPKELEDKFTDWTNNRPTADKDPSGQAALTVKFIEDVAAHAFLAGCDMPVMSFELLGPRASVTPAAVWGLWVAYVKSGEKGDLFAKGIYSESGDDAQFYLRYLAITMDRADFINKTMIAGMWRTDGPKAYQDAVIDPATKGKKDAPLPVEPWGGPARLLATMQKYLDLVGPVTQKYAGEITKFAEADQKVVDELNADFGKDRSKIVSRFARSAFHVRLGQLTELLSTLSEELKRVQDHMAKCQAFLAARKARSPNPPPVPPLPPFMLYDRSEQPL